MDKKKFIMIFIGSILIFSSIICGLGIIKVQNSKEVDKRKISKDVKEDSNLYKKSKEWSTETGPHNTVSNATGVILKVDREEDKILVNIDKNDTRFDVKEVWLVVKYPSKVEWNNLQVSDKVKFYCQTSQIGENPMKVQNIRKTN